VWSTKAISIRVFSFYLLITGGQKKTSYPNEIRNESESYFGIRYCQHGIKPIKFNDKLRTQVTYSGLFAFCFSIYISDNCRGFGPRTSSTTFHYNFNKNQKQIMYRDCTRGKLYEEYIHISHKKETLAGLKYNYLLFTEEFRNHMQLSLLCRPTKCLSSNYYASSKKVGSAEKIERHRNEHTSREINMFGKPKSTNAWEE